MYTIFENPTYLVLANLINSCLSVIHGIAQGFTIEEVFSRISTTDFGNHHCDIVNTVDMDMPSDAVSQNIEMPNSKFVKR
jgi:hypothetical protein